MEAENHLTVLIGVGVSHSKLSISLKLHRSFVKLDPDPHL